MKNKRIIAIVLILIIAVFVWVFGKMLPDIYSNLGQKNYAEGNYTEAYSDLKTAVFLSPKNRNARYYYVQTLISLRPNLNVQRELFNISQANLPDAADLIADMQISKWRNQIAINSGENYIDQAPFNDKVLRWDATKFPLKVYIQNNSAVAPKYYQESIQKAFLEWQEASNNLVSFKFVNNEKEANINVSINSSSDMKKCDTADCKYSVANTVPILNGDLLKKITISIYDSNNLGQPFSESQIYGTALHEIGHSLGIMGHSYNKDDIMYMENKQENTFDNLKNDSRFISSVDLNTLNLLYKLIPDITNTPLNQFDASHQFFAPIVLGNDAQINSKKMLEAQNYVESAPNLPNGYIDLASAYLEAKQYSDSIEFLNKALSLCSNNNEKFMVYYNFAVVYMEIKDWENTLKYANIAKQYNPSSDVNGLIAMSYYNLGKKELAKKSYAEALQQSPDNIIDAHNLATIYLKEFNFAQAGKVLNNLIKANPDAKNDPMIRCYGIITFFFK